MLHRSRAGTVLALAALTSLVALAAGATAIAAEKAIWGPTELPDGRSAFPVYQELGVDTLQLVLSWSAAAPTRPTSPRNPADAAYRWPAQVARAAAEADRHRMRLALMVTNAPGWSNGGRSPIWVPHSPRDFAAFVRAAARRYPYVRRWMIWGEPNRDDRFQPNAENGPVGPRAYASLLDSAHAALKAENPRNIVIGGNTWTNGTVKPRDFVRWMRRPNGKRPRLDWFGHNPFPFRFPKLSEPSVGGFRDISDTDTFSRELRLAYGRRVPLWLSEYTIQTGRGSDVFATYVSEQDQARYLTAGYTIADDLGKRVSGLGWLSLLDEPEATGSANWGVMTYGLRRKPSFGAFVRAPSERFSPKVSVARSSRRSLRLRLVLTPRRDGAIRVELRRGSRRVDRTTLQGHAGRRRAVVLRHAAPRRGLYSVIVRSGRGATVRRSIRVR